MKITIFEGTPEEYKEVASHLGKNSDGPSESEKNQVSVKDAFRAMLTRAKIHNGQLDMYRILAEGDLLWNEYCKRMNRSESQIRGVHGALGRRINGTPEIHAAGLPGNCSAIWTWNSSTGITGLKPDFVEVLKELEIV